MDNFNHVGLMVDNSRNAVMNVSTAKKMIDILQRLGCNTLMLYTEDTWEVNNQPYFGYLRGRYSKDELKELDTYAFEHGIELIPCIQTLAHLNAIMRWPKYAKIRDYRDTLCVGEEGVYELIEDMFATLSECFTSRLVNVGMDEAEMMGLGKYLRKHGLENRMDIFCKHIRRVSEIAEKYGFTMLMWSDMFYKNATGVYYRESSKGLSEEQVRSIRAQIPQNVRLVYWEYEARQRENYDVHMKNHVDMADNIWFAGGLWTWVGYAPHNAYAMEAGEAAIASCKDHDVKDMLFTAWGDNGAEGARFGMLPALYYNLCLMKGISDIEVIKAGFEQEFGIAYDDFMLLDLPGTTNEADGIHNSDKFMLFNDPFLGVMDLTIPENAGEGFASCAKKLERLSTHPEWGYLFASAQKLCEVLEIKATLGIRTRRAYQKDDREELEKLLDDYHKCTARIRAFYETYKKQWMKENKPHGFDVQDIRIGGLILRMEHCTESLMQYLSGEIVEIPELQEQILDVFGNGEVHEPKPFTFQNWAHNCTVNVI